MTEDCRTRGRTLCLAAEVGMYGVARGREQLMSWNERTRMEYRWTSLAEVDLNGRVRNGLLDRNCLKVERGQSVFFLVDQAPSQVPKGLL